MTEGILTTDDTDGTDHCRTLPIRVIRVIRGSPSDWNRERLVSSANAARCGRLSP